VDSAYFHGGGHAFGSPETAMSLTGNLVIKDVAAEQVHAGGVAPLADLGEQPVHRHGRVLGAAGAQVIPVGILYRDYHVTPPDRAITSGSLGGTVMLAGLRRDAGAVQLRPGLESMRSRICLCTL
jgi:hypothetical protein